MIRLFTDTAANLPFELTEREGIAVIQFPYTVDGVDQAQDREFDGAGFYGAMRRGAQVNTSMISVERYAEIFESAVKAGNDVIYVGMSGGISSSASAAALAAKRVCAAIPDARIAAIDTFAASLGEGLLVLKAAELIKRGLTFSEIEEFLIEARRHVCQYFTVDDLRYLRRTGRISGASALIGGMLNIKPILQGDESGHIVMCGKERGTKRAYENIAERYAALAVDKSADIGLAHADNAEGAAALIAMLRERGFTGECMSVCYEPVTGSHVGPGTVALFFLGVHK